MVIRRIRRAAMLWMAACAGLACGQRAVPAAEAKPAAKVTYAEHVRPILREHCFNCHNQNKATNDLALDSYERIRKGGASGEALTPGDPAGSLLWLVVNHESEPKMPPSADRLPPAKLDIIRQWIAGGALKDSGAKADVKAKPTMSLALSTGAGKPSGPAIMPEGLSRQPALYTPRAAAVTALAASPWAPLVAVAGQRQVSLYHDDSGELLGVLPFPEGTPYSLRFSRAGAVLLAGGGQHAKRGLVVAFDVKTGKRLFAVGDELDSVLAADISPDHGKVALGGPEKIVRCFSNDGTQLYEIRKHTDWIYAVEFSPDGVLLASGDRGGGLLVWEAESGREFQNLEGHKGGVNAVSFRPDGNILASASDDGTIKLWLMEDGRQLRSINAHSGGVTAVHFAADGRMVSSGKDRMVRIWDVEGRQLRQLGPMSEAVLRVVFSREGKHVVGGDWNGVVQAWAAADGKPAEPLPANPPTLAMAIEAARARCAAAASAASKAAAEAADATRQLDEGRKAKAPLTPLEKTQAEKAAAAKTAQEATAVRKAALESLLREKDAADKAAGAKK